MTATFKTVTGRKSHGLRQPMIDSSPSPIRTRSHPVEAATRGSGASPAPLLSATEIEAFISNSEFRFGGHSMTKHETAKKHERLEPIS